ncbi:hypothetical protein RND71_003027 [Anisodus tanguticus]|uniref:Uncharacterized protein n=1 Tax=Anisodus tanguticus TaxID=243964 RepID=A0AAE1SXY5_9SOLA|nr:hypothetical protein RND71_003027 [Anisodus tanguticus]
MSPRYNNTDVGSHLPGTSLLNNDTTKRETYKVHRGNRRFRECHNICFVSCGDCFLDHKMTICLFSGQAKEPAEIMSSFSFSFLTVGVTYSGLFLGFPKIKYDFGVVNSQSE